MFMDAETLFSKEQPLDNVNSTNMVDTGKGVDPGSGESALLTAVVTDGATGDLTVTVNTFAGTNDDPTPVATFFVPEARVEKGGVVLSARLPAGCLRYLQLAYSGATGGNISAGLVQGTETSQYPGAWPAMP